MRVLLIGEGPSELSGALRAFISRLGLSDYEIEQDRMSRRDIHAHHGKGKGYLKRAIRWMLEAQRREYDAVVLLVDQDDHKERVTEIDDAQESDLATIRRALGVAIRTFDAWMLADEHALTTVLEYQVSRQQNPENVTDPKRLCTELLEDSSLAIGAAEAYGAIASVADVGVLEERCPKGFAPFANRVRELSKE